MSRGVLIVRAEQEQSALELKLRERGYTPYCHSMVDIHPLTPSAEQYALWLETAWDGVVVVSPNAARFFASLLDDNPNSPNNTWPKASKHYFAVGPGTGEPLRELSQQAVTWPSQEHNSQALLQLPELTEVTGEQWLIINGAPGRSIIPDTLTERGANTTIASVYERVPKPKKAATIASDWYEQIDRILVSSKEQAELLAAYLQEENKLSWARNCHWVVPSERIAEVLYGINIPKPQIHFAASAMADDLVAATIRIKTAPPISDSDTRERDVSNNKRSNHKVNGNKAETPLKQKPKSRFWSRLFIFTLFISVLTLGAGGWYLWQQQQHLVSQTEQEFDALRARLSQAQQTDAEFEARLTTRLTQATNQSLAQQKEEHSRYLDELRAQHEQQHNRVRQQIFQQEQELLQLSQRVRATEQNGLDGWLLNEAYERVNVAVQRLSIDNDPVIALKLLQTAKDILITDSTQYQGIIQQLERDMEMIQAIPVVDYSATLLILQDLQRQVRHLVPHFVHEENNATEKASEPSASINDWRANLAHAWQTFSKDLVRIQRDVDLPLRLNQEQRLALNSRLELQLQLAQQALTRHQQEVFRTVLTETEELVSTYFVTSAVTTNQFLTHLRAVKNLNITNEFPTSLLSRAMLRERLYDLESNPQIVPAAEDNYD